MTVISGSICLSDIPKDLIKEVECKDGTKKKYLNIAVIERKEVSLYGQTHFVTCAPVKEKQVQGVNYIIGDMKLYKPAPSSPTTEQIDAAPPANTDDLPF